MLTDLRFRLGWSRYFAFNRVNDRCWKCAARCWTAPLPPPSADPFHRGQDFRTTLRELCRPSGATSPSAVAMTWRDELGRPWAKFPGEPAELLAKPSNGVRVEIDAEAEAFTLYFDEPWEG